MKKLLVLCCICLSITIFAYAQAVIHLESGETLKGKLVEKTDKYIKLDFEGIELTYWIDEIKSVQLSDGTRIYSKEESEYPEERTTPSAQKSEAKKQIKRKLVSPASERPKRTVYKKGDKPEVTKDTFKQGTSSSTPVDMGGVVGSLGIVFISIIIILVYAFVAYCLQRIASRTENRNGWLAWVPIANVYLMCKLGGKPGWWLLLFFIPLLNIIISITVWMGIAEARNKPGWLGILIIIPLGTIIVPAYLAFFD